MQLCAATRSVIKEVEEGPGHEPQGANADGNHDKLRVHLSPPMHGETQKLKTPDSVHLEVAINAMTAACCNGGVWA